MHHMTNSIWTEVLMFSTSLIIIRVDLVIIYFRIWLFFVVVIFIETTDVDLTKFKLRLTLEQL